MRVDDAQSFDSHAECKNESEKKNIEPAAPSILMKEPVPKDYRSQYWEDNILKVFWGKFETEDDYYAYTEKYRSEILKILDDMEKDSGK